MTKQQPCVTRLRLSSFFRCLAALCLLKICVLGLLLMDMPLPFLHRDQKIVTDTTPDKTRGDIQALPGKAGEEIPAAANANSAAAPEGKTSWIAQVVPAQAPASSAKAPLAPAQTAPREPLLVAGQNAKPGIFQGDESLLDMLGLTRLPIPSLGGVRTVVAAPLDLPAPSAVSGDSSPFAPAEQTAPLTMPGAPPIPANIPRGQSASGAPLAPRGGQASVPLPSDSGATSVPQLTPNIAPQAMPEDPNLKAQELARQQQDMLMLRRQMDDRLKDIENAEQKMQGMIREARGLEDKKIRHLIQVYANMKPKVAAKAIESLDERVAVRILSGMVPKQSGEILTYTAPEKTAKLTELLTRIRMPEE